VVPPGGPVAEVDLDTLAVAYHDLARPASLLQRLRDWLEPAAYAKSLIGPERQAYWVGDHSIAVVALEQAGIHRRGGEYRQLARAGGVELIDATNWSVRTLSERAGGIAVAGQTLLVYGGSFAPGEAFAADDGPFVTGLDGFTATGEQRFRLFPSKRIGYVQTAGSRAYVRTRGADETSVLDAETGRTLATVETPTPFFIVSP
jgi:hypothetical protein